MSKAASTPKPKAANRRRGCLVWGGGAVALLLLCGGLAALFGDRSAGEDPDPTAAALAVVLPTWTNTPDAQPTATDLPAPTATPEPPPPTLSAPTALPPATSAPVANDVANLRDGPGTDYAIAGSAAPGEALAVVGQTADGTWFQLSSGLWIAAALVDGVAGALPVVGVGERIAQSIDIEAAPTAAPVAVEAPVVTGSVVIVAVNKQSEYVDVQNQGAEPVDLSGWRLLSVRGEQDCRLGGVIEPGATLRIWSQQGDGGYSCGHGSDIWNNDDPDTAELYDAAGALVSSW